METFKWNVSQVSATGPINRLLNWTEVSSVAYKIIKCVKILGHSLSVLLSVFVVKVMMNKHPNITVYVVHCLWLQISADNMQIRISYFFQYLTLKNSKNISSCHYDLEKTEN